MTMTASDIRAKYLEFFKSKHHAIIPRANLVPQDDATTLFTGSGMQPLVPYLLGQKHPQGTKLVNSQTCFRAEDIDEVGDNRHTTLFEMLGNWSLGEYFKEQQIPWMFEFLVDMVGLDPSRLYVSCFIGAPEFNIPKDTEAAAIWSKLFRTRHIEAKEVEIGSENDGYQKGMQEGRIFFYDGTKNWWNRGKPSPQATPVGDPCGPDSEMFYDFGAERKIHENSLFKDKYCHVNCDCGRYMEIGNNVFMAYKKISEGQFAPLKAKNIDHGSGLERIAAAALNDPDVFKINIIWPIIEKLQELSGYDYQKHTDAMRIIADHLRAATFLAVDGVVPSNTAQGYVMRRFIRRAIRQALALDLREDFMDQIVPVITGIYADAYPEVKARQNAVMDVLMREETQFRKTLERGVREFQRIAEAIPADSDRVEAAGGSVIVIGEVTLPSGAKFAKAWLGGDDIFRLFDTYGFPPELSCEEARLLGVPVDPEWHKDFDRLMAEQKERSRTATVGQFKGGLADHSEMTTKYHTATHLMYKALRLVLGDHVIQRGSNITAERLRFDFSHPDKMTPEQISEVERIVNEQIDKDWPMGWREVPTEEALRDGALGAFGHKYGDKVKVYTVGDPEGDWYSKEICGGPHVEHTGQLSEDGKRFKITKEEASSAGVRRIKAVLQ